MKLTPGQEVWYAPHYGGPGHAVTVKKVGKKWASLTGHPGLRVDVSTGQVERQHFGYRGQVWESRLACEEERFLALRWDEFAREVSGYRPPGATLATIEATRKLLGMKEGA